MSEINILSIFKTSLISFVDELIGQFPQEPDLIILRIFLKDQVPIQDVMNKFIYAINKEDQKIKNEIKERTDLVFLKNEIFDEHRRTGLSRSCEMTWWWCDKSHGQSLEYNISIVLKSVIGLRHLS